MLIFIYSNLDSEELGQGTGKQHGDDFLDKYDFYNNWLIIFDDEIILFTLFKQIMPFKRHMFNVNYYTSRRKIFK